MVFAESPASRSQPQLAVSVDHSSPGRSRVSLTGELDVVTAPQAGVAFTDAFRSGARFVDVDVSGLTFCDAAGLRALTEAHLRWRSVSGRLVLRRVGPNLARLLRVTGLDETLAVEPPLTSTRLNGMDPSADQGQPPSDPHPSDLPASDLHPWSSHLHGPDRVAALRAELSHDPATDRAASPSTDPSSDASAVTSIASGEEGAPVPAELSTLSARLFDDRAEIRVSGELSLEVRGHLDDVVGWLIETDNKNVVVELDDLERMDRTSLEALFAASSRLRRAGGRLSLSFGDLHAQVLDGP